MDISVNNVRLSSINIGTSSWTDSNPSISTSFDELQNRSQRRLVSSKFGVKRITINAIFKASSQKEYDDTVSALYNIIANTSVMRIQKIYDTLDRTGSYNYMNPNEFGGQVSYDLLSEGYFKLMRDNALPSNRYYRGFLDGDVAVTLNRKFSGGTLYDLTLSFITAELPFELSTLDQTPVSLGSVSRYDGNVPLDMSSIDWTLVVNVTRATQNPTVTINGTTWTYTGSVAVGDVLRINPRKSMKVTSSGTTNITGSTNYKFFNLRKGDTVTSNMGGTYVLSGAYNMYK